MNAYELADELQELDAKLHLIVLFKSAEMLRQQADRIAEFEKLEQDFIRVIKQTNPNKPQTKPLSDEEIKNLHEQTSWWGISDPVKFARTIEERHGIK